MPGNEPLFQALQRLLLPKITSLSDLISQIRLREDPRWKRSLDKRCGGLCPFSSPCREVLAVRDLLS